MTLYLDGTSIASGSNSKSFHSTINDLLLGQLRTEVTDLAIIIVAADDAVMPQTKEAISHAQSAEIPFLIAINKCDREESNPDKIRTELAELGIQVEEWGGKTQTSRPSSVVSDAEFLSRGVMERSQVTGY